VTLYRALKGRDTGAYWLTRKSAEQFLQRAETAKISESTPFFQNIVFESGAVELYWRHPAIAEQGSHSGKFDSLVTAHRVGRMRRPRWLARKAFQLYLRPFSTGSPASRLTGHLPGTRGHCRARGAAEGRIRRTARDRRVAWCRRVRRGVSRARSTPGRDVALKVLDPALSSRSGADRLLDEARLIAATEHPNIVPLYEVDHQGDLVSLVMRFFPHGSLADRLERDGALPPATVARLGIEWPTRSRPPTRRASCTST